jgi:uncharacterized protein
MNFLKKLFKFLTRAYQLILSPWLPRSCRFTPSCSQYFLDSLDKDPFLKASFKTTVRICKCHPFHPGGHDPA